MKEKMKMQIKMRQAPFASRQVFATNREWIEYAPHTPSYR